MSIGWPIADQIRSDSRNKKEAQKKKEDEFAVKIRWYDLSRNQKRNWRKKLQRRN